MGIERLSFSYPSELKERLQSMATREQRSLSGMIQVILKEAIENYEINHPKKKLKLKRK